jgi:hypothetical protein
MKKTLALILALLMILSVALVSCGGEEEETSGTDDFFNIPGTDPTQGTDNNGGENEGGDENTNNSTSAGYVATNDTVYACYKSVLRADDKTTAEVVATVEFGTALTRVAKGRKWSQINFNGTEAYIANDLLTESKAAVTFKDVEEGTTRKVSKLGTSKNANLRQYPLSLSKPLVVDLETFNVSSIIGQIPKDTVVKVLKVSEDNAWAYVECEAMKAKGDGEYDTTASTLKGYCSTSVFDTGFGISNGGNANGGALG